MECFLHVEGGKGKDGTPDMESGKGRAAFTLIELMIVVAIIAIIAAIAIPNILDARREANRSAVMQTLNAFFKAALTYSLDRGGTYYWESPATDFGDYFHHKDIRFGYRFTYFSDDTNGDGDDKALKYVYIAVPLSTSNGKRAYFVTENHAMYMSSILNGTQVEELLSLAQADVALGNPDESRITKGTGVTWEPASSKH